MRLTKKEKKTIAWYLRQAAKDAKDETKMERAQSKDKTNECHNEAKAFMSRLNDDLRLLSRFASFLSK